MAASSIDVVELQARLQACSLSEEILTKRYEGKLARLQIALNDANARLKQETTENEQIRSQLEAKNRELTDIIDGFNRKKSCEIDILEADRRNRQKLESNLKEMAEKLAISQISSKFPTENEAQTRISALEQANEALLSEKRALQTTLLSIQRIPKPEIPTNKGKSLSKPCSRCESHSSIARKVQISQKEAEEWKEKAKQLVTKYYSALNKLKTESLVLKSEVKATKRDMEEEVQSTLESFRRYYQTSERTKAWGQAKDRGKYR